MGLVVGESPKQGVRICGTSILHEERAADVRVIVQHINHLLQCAWIQSVICVDVGQVLALCYCYSLVPCVIQGRDAIGCDDTPKRIEGMFHEPIINNPFLDYFQFFRFTLAYYHYLYRYPLGKQVIKPAL